MIKHNDLTATMLHELREPVQAIRGFLSIVLAGRTGTLSEVQHDFLSSANRAAVRLGRLIHDLDVAASSPGSLTLMPRQFSLRASVEACIAELRPMASDLTVDMTIDIRAQDQLGIVADPDRIDQILLNLLENALRYGVPGEPIRIHVRGGRTRVLCIVENAISAEVQAQDPDAWFRPYARGCDTRGQSNSLGRGLGLCVVERLVHAHHGQVLTRMRRDRVSMGFVLPRDVQPQLVSRPSAGMQRDWSTNACTTFL